MRTLSPLWNDDGYDLSWLWPGHFCTVALSIQILSILKHLDPSFGVSKIQQGSYSQPPGKTDGHLRLQAYKGRGPHQLLSLFGAVLDDCISYGNGGCARWFSACPPLPYLGTSSSSTTLITKCWPTNACGAAEVLSSPKMAGSVRGSSVWRRGRELSSRSCETLFRSELYIEASNSLMDLEGLSCSRGPKPHFLLSVR